MRFKTKKINYFKRLRKEFLPVFLLLSGMIIIVHYNSVKIYNSYNIFEIVAIISTLGLILGLFMHIKVKKYFHEIELTDQNIIFHGDSVNRPIVNELPLKNTEIYIKSKGRGIGNIEYFLKFKCNSYSIDINRLFNWEYSTLVELFYLFKKIKNEKIIWDEKDLLGFMEKKSKGLSTLDIAINPDKKDLK